MRFTKKNVRMRYSLQMRQASFTHVTACLLLFNTRDIITHLKINVSLCTKDDIRIFKTSSACVCGGRGGVGEAGRGGNGRSGEGDGRRRGSRGSSEVS